MQTIHASADDRHTVRSFLNSPAAPVPVHYLTMPNDDDFSRQLSDPNRRFEVLHALLGEGPCRQLGIYPIPDGFRLSVVIPVYNEERWIREIVRRVRAVPIPKEVIL